MPRNYPRKTERKKYDQDDLEEALEMCRAGEKVATCAKAYNIPRETLRDRLKGRCGVNGPTKGGGGRPPALSVEVQETLAHCLKTLSRSGFALTRDEVLNLVQTYVLRNRIKVPFKNGRPGEDWWLKFKADHSLSIRKPEPLEHSRKAQTNPFIIYGFFDLLEQTIERLGLENNPEQIWNCDETSFCHDPSKTKVVAPTNEACHRQTAGSGRENTTVLACVNAAGEKLPPLIIFRGKNIWDSCIPHAGDFPNTAYTAAPNGWMTSEIFEKWFTKTI